MAKAGTQQRPTKHMHMLLYVAVLAFVIVMAIASGLGIAFGGQRGKSNAAPTSDTAQPDTTESQENSSGYEPSGYFDGTYIDEVVIDHDKNDDGLPDSDEGYLVGVDVSEWNNDLDWETIQRGGIQFAILRCGITVGDNKTHEVDEQFKRNVEECERLNIPYGVYYFSSADDASEANAEARFVLSVIKDCNPRLPVFIDLEQSYMGDFEWMDTIKDISQAFCTTISAAGYEPGVYASVSWWEYLMTDPCYDQWAKWVADYSGYCTYADADCWQYTSQGEIYGTDWLIDLNIWYLKEA